MSLLAAVGVPLAANPGSTNVSVTNMSESGLIVLSICSVILAGFLLVPVMLAGRAPRQRGPASTPPWTGPVQGGVHLGDGRSVAPHRDAPAEGFDQEQVARGQAGAQATVVRDDEAANSAKVADKDASAGE
ncbi:MAG TPA: hypothetical protein VG268_17070 [Streptosporangiaceae bacterium]|jgi:hypothetical protein|nr:hypothetical protein [Streptosporangiaceae bacterium]